MSVTVTGTKLGHAAISLPTATQLINLVIRLIDDIGLTVTLCFHFIAFCSNMIQVRAIESSMPFFLRAEPRNRMKREPVNV